MNTYGYARVSSRDQNLQRQITAFTEFGIDKRRIFSDKKSGKDFERKEYKKLIKKLKRGDLLVIKSIDRLGRNCDQIIKLVAIVINSFEYCFLGMPKFPDAAIFVAHKQSFMFSLLYFVFG